MRIGFLTHEPFYPPSGGGSAEAVYIAREFVRRGHDLHLFCPQIDEPERIQRDFSLQLHPFTAWRMGRYARFRNLKYILYPQALERLVARTAAQTPFDVLVSQHTISAVAAGRLRRRLRQPVVFNFLDYLTGFMETWPRWVLPTPALHFLNRYEMSMPRRFHADGVLTVSDPLADRFAATGFPRARIQAIQYGYDPAYFRMDPSLRPQDGAPIVIMHGSFDQHHLGAIARDAVCTVATARPSTRFRFVGRETDGLKRFAADVRARCPGARLELAGFVPYADMGRELAAATVGLVPYEESNGTHCAFVAKAVEYLAAGLGVASTPLENLKRYFHDDPGIRFSGFDGKSLASVILSWLDTPSAERDRIGRASSQRVERELTWDRVARTAVDFVEATVARTKREGLGN